VRNDQTTGEHGQLGGVESDSQAAATFVVVMQRCAVKGQVNAAVRLRPKEVSVTTRRWEMTDPSSPGDKTPALGGPANVRAAT